MLNFQDIAAITVEAVQENQDGKNHFRYIIQGVRKKNGTLWVAQKHVNLYAKYNTKKINFYIPMT